MQCQRERKHNSRALLNKKKKKICYYKQQAILTASALFQVLDLSFPQSLSAHVAVASRNIGLHHSYLLFLHPNFFVCIDSSVFVSIHNDIQLACEMNIPNNSPILVSYKYKSTYSAVLELDNVSHLSFGSKKMTFCATLRAEIAKHWQLRLEIMLFIHTIMKL